MRCLPSCAMQHLETDGLLRLTPYIHPLFLNESFNLLLWKTHMVSGKQTIPLLACLWSLTYLLFYMLVFLVFRKINVAVSQDTDSRANKRLQIHIMWPSSFFQMTLAIHISFYFTYTDMLLCNIFCLMLIWCMVQSRVL